MTKDIRIILVDDNPRIRESISLLLNSSQGFNLVGVFENAHSINQKIEMFEPNVVLMDIDMPEFSGIDAVKAIRLIDEDLPIMMLTGFDDDEKVFNAVCAGATGYLLKNTEPKKILECIKEINEGGAPMSPSVARKVLSMMKNSNSKKPDKEVKLSKREKEVLELLVHGKSYKMIASDLNISYETVHSHIKRIYKELQVNSSTEAVVKTLKNKIL